MQPIKLTCQLSRVVTTKDGGGKLTLEFGHDSIEAVHQLQLLNGIGEVNLAVVIVPFEDNQNFINIK